MQFKCITDVSVGLELTAAGGQGALGAKRKKHLTLFGTYFARFQSHFESPKFLKFGNHLEKVNCLAPSASPPPFVNIYICLMASNKQPIQWIRITVKGFHKNIGLLEISKQTRIPPKHKVTFPMKSAQIIQHLVFDVVRWLGDKFATTTIIFYKIFNSFYS